MPSQLKHMGYIELPDHVGKGGFDHADVHAARGEVYLAHTANDCVDVIDTQNGCYTHSIHGLSGVAGALVSAERDLVFTSNRRGNSVGVFSPDREDQIDVIPAGNRPNGLAYDHTRNLLLAANVGDPESAAPPTVSLIDVGARRMIADLTVAGRTRWAVFDPTTAAFYVNISLPAQIAVIQAQDSGRLARHIDVPVAGPHGLDVDSGANRLFCACDGKALVTLSLPEGSAVHQTPLSGVPDVIFFDKGVKRIYVAAGDPGVIDVIDSDTLELLETLVTEKGAHTFALDKGTHLLYVLLPATHRAMVLAPT